MSTLAIHWHAPANRTGINSHMTIGKRLKEFGKRTAEKLLKVDETGRYLNGLKEVYHEKGLGDAALYEWRASEYSLARRAEDVFNLFCLPFDAATAWKSIIENDKKRHEALHGEAQLSNAEAYETFRWQRIWSDMNGNY